jgi:hypothetical protein
MAVIQSSAGLRVSTSEGPAGPFEASVLSAPGADSMASPKATATLESVRALWLDRARRFRFVEPTFSERPSRRKLRYRLSGLKHVAETSGTWSGGIVAAANGDSLSWVKGVWAMPTANLPPNAASGVKYCASTWVGLDGDEGSSDVLQAGCDADVTSTAGTQQRQFLPWWEWYPAGSFWITNMPVNLGDTLDCLITVQLGSSSAATISFGNQTTGVAHNWSATAPAGVSLSGNCAEWIVESFGSLGPLPQFSAVDFTSCAAGTAGGQALSAGDANTIVMVDANGQALSTATIPDSSTVKISYG